MTISAEEFVKPERVSMEAMMAATTLTVEAADRAVKNERLRALRLAQPA
ncbi:hypothetical protein J2T09_003499 [Neorhizobium huautlense]|uniref:Uncharacterized protein n=1 Tax=Neorhizobium huautlense TaxID=67774 RepID=A0ABT9PW83_9HYPH|nr:hypothetical protein [Neorhizobium huautlense]MDP9838727.1 hypothetical protein [Neorhizobium huautlense]